MTKYWLAITNQENWKIIKEHKIYAIDSDKKFQLLNVGDFFVMYLIPKRICGIVKVTKLKTKIKEKFHNKDYKYYFEVSPLTILSDPLPVADKWTKINLIEHISIFKKAKRWGGVLMGTSLNEITKEDFEFIRKNIRKQFRIKFN